MQLLAYIPEPESLGLWPGNQVLTRRLWCLIESRKQCSPALFQARLVWKLSHLGPPSQVLHWHLGLSPKNEKMCPPFRAPDLAHPRRDRSNRKVGPSLGLARSTPSKAELLVLLIQNSLFLPSKAPVTVPRNTFSSLCHWSAPTSLQAPGRQEPHPFSSSLQPSNKQSSQHIRGAHKTSH